MNHLDQSGNKENHCISLEQSNWQDVLWKIVKPRLDNMSQQIFTNLWIPCQLQTTLSSRQQEDKPNTEMFFSFMGAQSRRGASDRDGWFCKKLHAAEGKQNQIMQVLHQLVEPAQVHAVIKADKRFWHFT